MTHGQSRPREGENAERNGREPAQQHDPPALGERMKLGRRMRKRQGMLCSHVVDSLLRKVVGGCIAWLTARGGGGADRADCQDAAAVSSTWP